MNDAAHAEAPVAPAKKLSGIDGLIKVLDVLSKLAVLGGGAFALYQFLEAKTDQRIGRSVTYIESFDRGDVSEARNRINAALRPYVGQFVELEQSGGVSLADRDDIVLSLIESDELGALPDAVDRVVEFYSGLSLCVRESICDDRVVANYFCQTDMLSFQNTFDAYFRQRQVNNPTYASGVRELAARCPPASS